jgi:hypothetical protein
MASIRIRLRLKASAMPGFSDWRPSRPHVKLMSSRNCGREFHAQQIHIFTVISTIHNFQQATFRHQLRSNITSSEEQSSSRRERNRGRPGNRQRNSGLHRGSFCSERSDGNAKTRGATRGCLANSGLRCCDLDVEPDLQKIRPIGRHLARDAALSRLSMQRPTIYPSDLHSIPRSPQTSSSPCLSQGRAESPELAQEVTELTLK